MSEEWMDVREAFKAHISSIDFHGKGIRPVYHQLVDDYGAPLGPFPQVVIYSAMETRSYVDQLDRVTLHAYTDLGEAQATLQAVIADFPAYGFETDAGYLDSVEIRNGPELLPYPSDVFDQATVTLEVVHRPL